MIKTISFAAMVLVLGASVAQACPQHCGAPHPVAVHHPVVIEQSVAEVKPLVLPPHFIVEQGPVYDGLGVVAKPRVFKPRHATFFPTYTYGYGVGFSGGPVALASYPYVRRHPHLRRPPLRVYY